MKKIMLLFALVSVFAFSNLLYGQVLLNEDFTFSDTLNGHNGWVAHSGLGANPIGTVPGLTYAGYPGSAIGNAAFIKNTGGEDVNRTFTAQTGNGTNIYVSLLVNVTDTAQSKVGDYILNLGTLSVQNTFTIFCGRLLVRKVAGNVNFGVENLSTTPTYGTTNFAINTTYLLIMKYSINTAGADTVKLWVVPSGVPVNELAAGTPEHFIYTEAGKDTVNAIALRQGSSSNSVGCIVDGIHVANMWNDIVPVELTSFTASTVNNAVRLNWSTATEKNNQVFVVERSANKANWSKIAFVNGNGTSTSPINYSYLDNSTVNGKYYYRLKQMDQNGSFDYSIVVEADVAAPKEYKLYAN
ncbi:MAG: hypothetical protein Q8903_15170, partial [Bacteroidota bacterium]|nr:hypothetical protein [Bacteroidota bacterium]